MKALSPCALSRARISPCVLRSGRALHFITWPASESTLEQAGYGAGSVLGTLVYAPFKATFCILGGIGAAFTAIASPPTAGQVARASCGGTWLIAPGVVTGDESVKFVGDGRRARTVGTDAVALR